MNVLHINTIDSLGGAGRAAFRLHSGLRYLDIKSRFLVRTKHSNSDDVKIIGQSGTAMRLMDKVVVLITNRFGLQYLYYPSTHLLNKHPWFKQAEIINLHNTHGDFFAHTALPKLSKKIPIVWTLHDMWSLTGHCSYSGDCERWLSGCGKCPDLNIYPKIQIDTTSLLWKIKKSVYANSSLSIVTPSQWLANLVTSSPLTSHFEVKCIPNSVDTDIFKPIPKPIARHALNLPIDRKYLLFLADKLEYPRKGGEILIKALIALKDQISQPIEIIMVGRGGQLWENFIPFPVHYIGFVSNERLMTVCYGAADIYILPTRQDNLPNALLESMACGIPSVAFAVGGVPEVITHMKTGYLAQAGSPKDLSEGINLMLSDNNLRKSMSRKCREIAMREYHLSIQAKRYNDFYHHQIEKNKSLVE